MNKRPNFTPQTLKRYEKEQRGLGIHEDYVAFHQVRRADPSSHGRSGRYLINGNGRESHLLSTTEYIAAIMCKMIPGVIDIREQFPLSLHSSVHELNEYENNAYGKLYPGAMEIAKQLNVAYPRIKNGVPWPLTTDLLVTTRVNNKLGLIPISCKSDTPLDKNSLKNLSIERKYWVDRGEHWLLITPKLWHPAYADTLRESYAHAFIDNAQVLIDNLLIDQMVMFIKNEPDNSFSDLFKYFVSKKHLARAVKANFWHGFFFGLIPMETKFKFNPKKRIRLIDWDAFKAQNPILSRRSAWNLE